MNIKQKFRVKIREMTMNSFLNLILEVLQSRLLLLVYSNRDTDVKTFKVQRYCLPKGSVKNHNVIINGKN